MKRLIPTASVLLAGILWGIMPLFVRGYTAIGLTTLQLCAIRLGGAALTVFAALACIRPALLRVRLRDLPLLAALGIVGMLLMSICYFSAITLTTASVAAILLYTAPIFILVFSCLFFREKFTKQKLLALLLAFVGCILASGITGGAVFSPLGFLVGLLSGITYASYSIIGRFALRSYSSVTVSAYAFAFSALGAVFFLNPMQLTSAVSATPSPTLTVLGLVALSLLSGVAPAMLYTFGLSKMEAGRAGILVCVEPMTATLVSIFILHEPTTPVGVAGIVFILAAILILNLATHAPREKEEKL